MPHLRTGKIARLPGNLRDQLNRRLHNGSSASRILPWLNALPEVKAVLKEYFHSRPINPQNLSEWTQGGYRDWLHVQESHDLAHCLDEDTTTFTGSHSPLTDTLNHWVATRLILRTRRINELSETEPAAADQLLHQMTRELVALQRAHTQARREQRQRDQLAFHQDQLRQKTEAAREQTIADHEAWALHPRNHNHLRNLLLEAYPDDFVDVPDTDTQPPASTKQTGPDLANPSEENLEDDIENEPEEDFDGHPGDDFDDISSAHSESGPTAGTVILSEVEGPHTSALASSASPHQSADEGPSTHSKSLSHQPSLPPAIQVAIHDQLSTSRTELRILRLRMGLNPDPVDRREAVSCL